MLNQNKLKKLADQFEKAIDDGDTIEEITEFLLDGLIEEIPKQRPELTKEEVIDEAASYLMFIYEQLGIVKGEALH